MGGWLLTWLLYSLAASPVLWLLRRYPVSRPAAVLVVGATYGWIVEGALTTSVAAGLPFTLVWTAVAWHALLTVGVGWYVVPRALQRGGARAVGCCALVGLAWGLWSITWWGVDPDPGEAVAVGRPLADGVFMLVVTAALALGYGLQWRLAPSGPPPRRPSYVVLGLLLLWAVPFVMVPVPWAAPTLGALLALGVLTLRRLAAGPVPAPTDLDGARLVGVGPGAPWRRLPPLAAVPVVAWLTSVAADPLSGGPTGHGLLFEGFVGVVGLLSLVGTAALGWALWQAWRRPAATVAPG